MVARDLEWERAWEWARGLEGVVRARGKHKVVHWCPPPLTCKRCGGLIGLTKDGIGCPKCVTEMKEAREMTDQAKRKIVVPEGMLKAAVDGSVKWCDRDSSDQLSIPQHDAILEAALRWLAENPIVPTQEQIEDVWNFVIKADAKTWIYPTLGAVPEAVIEWQHRMFLAPEPPSPLGFLECDTCRAKSGWPTLCSGCFHNRQVIEEMTKAMSQASTQERPEVKLEPEVPEAIRDLLDLSTSTEVWYGIPGSGGRRIDEGKDYPFQTMESRILEAYRRGQQSK